MYIQSYSYTCVFGYYDAIAQLVEQSALSEPLYDCLVYKTLTAPELYFLFIRHFFFFFLLLLF